MSKHILRGLFAAFICMCAVALMLSRPGEMMRAMAAPTPTPVASASATPTPSSLTAPGTQINNAATATYSDGTNTYNIQSNTVTVTVQNAPSLVILTNNGASAGAVTTNGLQPAASPVPGNYLSDIYTLVNTGNASGNFIVASASQTSPTPTPSPNSGSGIQSGPATGVTYTVTCGTSLNDTVSTLTALNTDLASASCATSANGSVNVAVNYQANGTGTVNSQIEAQIAYSGTGTGYTTASSLWVSNQYSDAILADERVDIYKSPSPIASDGTVTYGVYVNNAGYSPANYVTDYGPSCTAPVKVCGSALTGPGLLISDKVPLGKTSTPLPVVSMAPTTGTGLTSGETPPKMVYTTDSTGKTGWTLYSGGGVPAGAYYVGVLLTGNTNGIGLLANPTPAATSTPGYVPSATSQVGFSVQIGPMPAGTSVPNYVVAPAGDNKACMEGPGLTTTATACDANGANPPSPGPTSTPGDPSIPIATAPPASGTPPPGGSNTAIVSIASLLNGPVGQPDAQGCFNSGATPVPFPVFSPNPLPTISPTTSPTCPALADNNDDYTQAVATPNPAATIVYGTTAPSNLVAAVASSVKNPSTTATKIQVTFPTLPANLSVTNVLVGSCAAGTAATLLSAGVYDLGTVAAGATVTYCVDYSTVASPASYYFQPLYVQVRAAMESSPNVYYNDTWHVVLPGGFEELVKTATMLNNGNCAGAITGGLPSLGVCPGGLIQYAVMYYNTLPATSSGSPAEPAAANLAVNGNFIITENGAAAGSNWATYTGGLFDPASAASPMKAGLTLATMQASCGVTTQDCGDTEATATFGQVSGAGGNALNATAFTDTIPAASANLQAQHYGVLMFATKVK